MMLLFFVFIIISQFFFLYRRIELAQSVVAMHRIISKVVAKSNKLPKIDEAEEICKEKMFLMKNPKTAK